MEKKTFSLLIFHGSARRSASEAAFNFASRLQQEGGCSDFAICFLKGVDPELRDALKTAIDAGNKLIRLIPLFLLPGTHTESDIPAIAREFMQQSPDVTISISDCLVNTSGFLDCVAQAVRSNSEDQ